MTQDLAQLEREVIEARRRLEDDLARVRSPTASADFGTELSAELRAYAGEYLEAAKKSGIEAAQSAFAALKDKALANPAAAFAIGAGLAWRLARNPPVASLLIGGGLISLLSTGRVVPAPDPYDAAHPSGYVPGGIAGQGYPPADQSPLARSEKIAATAQYQAAELAGSVQDAVAQAADTVRDVAGRAAEAGAQAGEALKERVRASIDAVSQRAQAAKDKAQSSMQDLSRNVEDGSSKVRAAAGDYAERAANAAHAIVPENIGQGKYLLGAAALAVGAALGIALYRGSRGSAS